jgi:hypothetical protein
MVGNELIPKPSLSIHPPIFTGAKNVIWVERERDRGGYMGVSQIEKAALFREREREGSE